MEPFDDCGRYVITMEYYPEYYLRVDLRLLLTDRKDGTYHLSGFTRYAVDQDTTAMVSKEFPQVGVRLDNAVGIGDFFKGSVTMLNPQLRNVELFDVK
jgi:hypothetical protein